MFLLLCLVIPFTLTYSFLHYQKKHIKNEIKRKIIDGNLKENLVLLKFTELESKSLLRWEHPKEFEFKDRMYDVVVTEVKNDTIHYWCWLDNDETKLNQQLNKLLAYSLCKNPKNHEKQERLTNFFKSLYLSRLQTCGLPSYKSTQRIDYYAFNSDTLFRSPPVPPPQRIG